MIQVTNLGVAGGVFVVGFLRWNLLKHGSKEHVESGVILDHGLELLDHGRKFFRIVVDVLGDMAEPLSLDTMVCGQPTAGSVDGSTRFLSHTFILWPYLCTWCSFGMSGMTTFSATLGTKVQSRRITITE